MTILVVKKDLTHLITISFPAETNIAKILCSICELVTMRQRVETLADGLCLDLMELLMNFTIEILQLAEKGPFYSGKTEAESGRYGNGTQNSFYYNK